MIWMPTASDENHRYQFISGWLYFSTCEYTFGVTVEQQSQHHLWWVRRAPTTAIRQLYCADVQLRHNLYHKTSRIVFTHPTLAVPRQIDRLISVNDDKVLADDCSAFVVNSNPKLF